MTEEEIQIEPEKYKFSTLSERDLILYKIQEDIENKKCGILNKQVEVKNKQQINEFLEEVRENYDRYYTYILKQKEQQYLAMQLLKDYLNDLVKNKKIAEGELEGAKYEQLQIVREMDKIQTELDELVKMQPL